MAVPQHALRSKVQRSRSQGYEVCCWRGYTYILHMFLVFHCSVSEESDTTAEWHTEGKRLVAPLHRHLSRTSHHTSSGRNTSSARSVLRSERPANLRSAAAITAATPITTKQGAQLHSFCFSSYPTRQTRSLCVTYSDYLLVFILIKNIISALETLEC